MGIPKEQIPPAIPRSTASAPPALAPQTVSSKRKALETLIPTRPLSNTKALQENSKPAKRARAGNP